MNEIWKDVKGFEGIYQISNKGRLKSFKQHAKGKILSNKNKNGDYLSIVLCKGGKVRSTRIHRLVAEAFIPNPNGKPQINHKDSNRQNNNVGNLEWVTAKENSQHAIKANPGMVAGLIEYRKKFKPKRVAQTNLNGKLVYIYMSAKHAGRCTGVCSRNILQVANRTEYKPGLTRKQAGGWGWRFADDVQDIDCSDWL